MAETSYCVKCQKDLPVSEFYFRKEKGQYRSCCKKCKSVNTKEEIAARLLAGTKVCKHCNIEKPTNEYQKSGKGKWLQPYCKICDSSRKRRYCQDNSGILKIKHANYYLKVKDKLSAKGKAEREVKRPETLKRIRAAIDAKKMTPDERKRRKSECDKRYRQNNKEKISVMKKNYSSSLNGKEQSKAWQKKMMNDVEFRTKKRLRGRIYVALKRGVKSESTIQLLGCSIEYFKQYFESLFTDEMSWDKYIDGGIHIDHIIPCSHFNLTDPLEQKKCFHYTNLQPLWGIDNLRKGVSLNYNKTQ